MRSTFALLLVIATVAGVMTSVVPRSEFELTFSFSGNSEELSSDNSPLIPSVEVGDRCKVCCK